jgi:hypothetical protein
MRACLTDDDTRMILSWQEHLSADEMPPRWMWELDEELARHFEKVKDARDSGQTMEPAESGAGMMKNALAEGRGRNASW